MGERKMLQKERKSPSQKKKAVAPAKPKWPPYSLPFSCSCPSLSHNIGSAYMISYMRSCVISDSISGMGGITKSWISSCFVHQQPKQTWPQLVQTNISPDHRTANPLKSDISFQFYVRISYGKYVSAMVVTGISSPAFAFYRRDAKDYDYRGGWRMRNCRIMEPYSGDDRHMEFTNAIGFQGKFYAISLQGSLVLIEDEGDSGNFEITALGRNRAVPYCKVSKHFREYLLVCEKEIYLVFLLSRVSINVVDGVEVFRLDTSRLSWEKVDRLKDDVMFFLQDDRCLGISASSLGCNSKGSNCVYFTHDRANGYWFVYDMETSCISVTSGPEIDHPIPEFRRR